MARRGKETKRTRVAVVLLRLLENLMEDTCPLQDKNVSLAPVEALTSNRRCALPQKNDGVYVLWTMRGRGLVAALPDQLHRREMHLGTGGRGVSAAAC